MQSFQKSCDVVFWYLAFVVSRPKSRSKNLFWNFCLFMVPCHHVLWLLCPLLPRTYSKTTLFAISPTLFALNSHYKSWPLSPFNHISPLSHSCLEYALVKYQLSSYIQQFLCFFGFFSVWEFLCSECLTWKYFLSGRVKAKNNCQTLEQ